MKKFKLTGSYILIKPIKKEKTGIWKGEIAFFHSEKKLFPFGSEAVYLDRDITDVIIDGDNFHVILHYHIIGIYYEESKPDSSSSMFDGFKIS